MHRRASMPRSSMMAGSKTWSRWTWYGFDRQRKRVVTYVNDRRTDQECRRLMRQISRCHVSYLHTNGWPSYRRVLPQTRHLVSKGGTLRIEQHNPELQDPSQTAAAKDDLLVQIRGTARCGNQTVRSSLECLLASILKHDSQIQ